MIDSQEWLHLHFTCDVFQWRRFCNATNCEEKTLYSFRIFFYFFALEIYTFRITAFCDEIFDITFVATIAKIFANRIVESFSVKRVPNLRKVVSGTFSELRK